MSASKLENKTQESLVLSEKPIKIGFVHYFFDLGRAAGVWRVVDGNDKAFKERYPNYEPVFIAGDFKDGVFKEYKQHEIVKLAKAQLVALKNTKEIRVGKLTYEQYRPSITKPSIDEIDRALAKHYNFTEEELDFIINYDIKYRMGKDNEEEAEDLLIGETSENG